MRRRASGCETLTHFALALRLCAARCLRRLGRLDEAEYAFKVLAGKSYDKAHIPDTCASPMSACYCSPQGCLNEAKCAFQGPQWWERSHSLLRLMHQLTVKGQADWM